MLDVTALPVLKDNYTWVLSRPGGRAAAIIDPGEAAPVLAHLAARGLELAAILVTHHHGDHSAGIPGLLGQAAVPVYAPALETVTGRTHAVADGAAVEVAALGLELHALHVPGHTAGAVAYFGEGLLFSGDTLFAAGCGRLFEGTAAQMHASLRRLAALPRDTLLCCGHEYTLANLRFAEAVEPGNQAVLARIAHCAAERAQGRPTVPAPLGLELDTNPFLRTREPTVRRAAETWSGRPLGSEVDVFAALRAWKNAFA